MRVDLGYSHVTIFYRDKGNGERKMLANSLRWLADAIDSQADDTARQNHRVGLEVLRERRAILAEQKTLNDMEVNATEARLTANDPQWVAEREVKASRRVSAQEVIARIRASMEQTRA